MSCAWNAVGSSTWDTTSANHSNLLYGGTSAAVIFCHIAEAHPSGLFRRSSCTHCQEGMHAMRTAAVR